MKIKEPWKRLEKGHFWQIVDAEHNRLISEQLKGCTDILDLGCGYGSLTSYLTEVGFNTYGVDADENVVTKAKQLFPSLSSENIQVMDANFLDFQDERFDGVVLRDTMHHLWEEGDIEQSFGEIERVLKPGGTLVIFDPNPNFIVLTSRWIARHQDAQCSFQTANDYLLSRGWIIKETFFNEFFALALSGGYVGIELVPKWPIWHKALIKTNRNVSEFLSRMEIGSKILWRYCIKAEKNKPPKR